MAEDLTWLPAWRIVELIASREVSPVQVTNHFLERIRRLNPQLHAFVSVDEAGAIEQAEQAEIALDSGKPIGPLHGVPIALMEYIKARGLPSQPWGITNGARDDICVERLRAAGAIFVGMTSTYFFDPEKHPRNPWDPTKEPGNSSRGSAIAAAAALVPIAIGGDGAGSTRLPAAFSGVAGLHTTRGLIPHADPDKPSLITTTSVGPMARSVRDCAIATQVMAGPDGRDPICIQSPAGDYLASIDKGVEGVRMAWTDDFGYAQDQAVAETPRVLERARAAAFSFSAQGATIETVRDVWEDPRPGLMGFIGAFASVAPMPPMPVFEQGMGAHHDAHVDGDKSSQQTPQPSPPDYQTALDNRAKNWGLTRRLFSRYDVLLSATTPMVTRPIEEWGLRGGNYIFTTYSAHTAMFNLLGFPAISVPCGLIDGLPIGLQIVAPPGREDLILRVASAFQKANPFEDRPLVS